MSNWLRIAAPKKVRVLDLYSDHPNKYEDAGDDNVDSAYDEQGETFEGSLPAWPLRADVEENIDDSHVQDSMHSLDEFFVADMPQDFDSNSYTYNTSDPEMQEISGNPITST